MSDIETADAHAQRIEALWKHGAHHCIYSQGEAAKLIEARDNAVRIAAKREALQEYMAEVNRIAVGVHPDKRLQHYRVAFATVQKRYSPTSTEEKSDG